MRSMLFVPGDRPERFGKAESSGADAVILDLEDAVAAAQRPMARAAIGAHLRQSSRPVPLWVRINPVDSADALADLAAIIAQKPDGLLLPKARNGLDVARLDHWLEALETSHGLTIGGIKIIPMITETAGAMLQLASFASLPPRVVGVTWGAEDLAAELGAQTSRDEGGRYEMPYQMASAGCLFVAAAAQVAAIDTVDTEITDITAVEQRARLSRRSGYVAKLAIHPAQIPALHAAFTPSAAELAHAEAVIAAFAKDPGVGALRVDGKLVDRPHLLQAERLLAAARRR